MSRADSHPRPSRPPTISRSRGCGRHRSPFRHVVLARRSATDIYVTLGSSGRVQVLPMVIDVAARLGYQVLIATAGRPNSIDASRLPRHVYVADYLPGTWRLADQSWWFRTAAARPLQLWRSTPGPWHRIQPDQYRDDGHRGGRRILLLRAGTVDREQLRAALTRLDSEPSFTTSAARLGTNSPTNAARRSPRSSSERSRIERDRHEPNANPNVMLAVLTTVADAPHHHDRLRFASVVTVQRVELERVSDLVRDRQFSARFQRGCTGHHGHLPDQERRRASTSSTAATGLAGRRNQVGARTRTRRGPVHQCELKVSFFRPFWGTTGSSPGR